MAQANVTEEQLNQWVAEIDNNLKTFLEKSDNGNKDLLRILYSAGFKSMESIAARFENSDKFVNEATKAGINVPFAINGAIGDLFDALNKNYRNQSNDQIMMTLSGLRNRMNVVESSQKKKNIEASRNGSTAMADLSEAWGFDIIFVEKDENLLQFDNVFKNEDYTKIETRSDLVNKLKQILKDNGTDCLVFDANKELLCDLFQKQEEAAEMVSSWESVAAKPDALICIKTNELSSFDIEAEIAKEAKIIQARKRGKSNKISKTTLTEARNNVLRRRNEIIKKNILVVIDTKRPVMHTQQQRYVANINDGQATTELCVFEVLLDETDSARAPLVFESSMMDDTQVFAKNRAYYFTGGVVNSSNSSNNSNSSSNNDKKFTLNICDVSCDVMIHWIDEMVQKYGTEMKVDDNDDDSDDNEDTDNLELSLSMRDRDNQGIIPPTDNQNKENQNKQKQKLPDLPNMCSVFAQIKQSNLCESESSFFEHPLIIINQNEWNMCDAEERRDLFLSTFANQSESLLSRLQT